jgi:uncharacterized membrane protein
VDVEGFFILLIIVVVLAPVVLAIAALVQVSHLRQEVTVMRERVAALRAAAQPPLAEAAPEAGPTAEPARRPDEEAREAAETGEEEPARAPAEAAGAPEPPGIPQVPLPVAARSSLEERIASRWMVWLGAVTIALAGIFLVKYASDSGLLGPAVRIAMGIVLGLVLAIAGEWVRRHPEHGMYVRVEGSYVAPALTSAGIFVAFASVYAAYALYALIPSGLAFVALAGIALLAFALSLLQGRFVALLGIVGGFTTPFLVSSTAPSALNLFAYLFVIATVSLALVRYRCWWWLSFVSIAGAGLWVLFWLVVAHDAEDALVVGLFLVAMLALVLFFWRGIGVEMRAGPWYSAFLRYGTYEQASWIGAAMVAVLLPIYMEASDYTTAAVIMLGLACVVGAARATEVQRLEGLVVLYGLAVLVVISAWRVAAPDPYANPFPLPGGARFMGPVLAPELVPYVSVAVAFAALFGIGGFFAAWRARRTAVWAGVSAAVPVCILVLAYFRVGERIADINWSYLALGLAALLLVAAQRVLTRRGDGTMNDALGLYAAGVVAGLGIAVAMVFEHALLTVVLSVMLPALAWIDDRLKVPLLRWVAAVLGGIVLVRLTLNVNVFDYPIGRDIGSNWVLYGYGIPALSFFVAARWFARSGGAERLVILLEAGALLFFTLFVSLEIRTLVEGSLDARRYSLFEASLQTLAWLVIGESRARACLLERRFVSLWGGRVLILLGLAHLVLVHVIALNPVLTHQPVGSWPLVNYLALAYLVPAIALLVVAMRLHVLDLSPLKQPVRGLSFVLVFIYVTLEVQRWFQGPVLTGDPQSSAEVYAYSAAWLALSLVLLVLGIRSASTALRYGALVALLATVLKVFLYDMGDLTGLWRVASFLGLGLCLIGIGYVYQRYVFPPGGAAVAPQPEG